MFADGVRTIKNDQPRLVVEAGTGAVWALDETTGHRVNLSGLLRSYKIEESVGDIAVIELRCYFSGYRTVVVGLQTEELKEERAITL